MPAGSGIACVGSSGTSVVKFFQIEGRFPYYPQEVPQAAIEHVVRQTGWASADWWRYDWERPDHQDPPR